MAAYQAAGKRDKAFEDWQKIFDLEFPGVLKNDPQKKDDKLLPLQPLPPLPPGFPDYEFGDFPFYDDLPPP
jgi:hypothetical protein